MHRERSLHLPESYFTVLFCVSSLNSPNHVFERGAIVLYWNQNQRWFFLSSNSRGFLLFWRKLSSYSIRCSISFFFLLQFLLESFVFFPTTNSILLLAVHFITTLRLVSLRTRFKKTVKTSEEISLFLNRSVPVRFNFWGGCENFEDVNEECWPAKAKWSQRKFCDKSNLCSESRVCASSMCVQAWCFCGREDSPSLDMLPWLWGSSAMRTRIVF